MATSRKRRHHNVAKTVLLGDLANALEKRHLTVAGDLLLKKRFQAEFESLSVKTTTAGNQVLDATRTETTGHADVVIVTALALYHRDYGPGFAGEGKVTGWS